MELKASWWTQALELESEGGAHSLVPPTPLPGGLGTFQKFSRKVLVYISLSVPKVGQGFQSMDLLYTPLPTHLPNVFLKCMVYCF